MSNKPSLFVRPDPCIVLAKDPKQRVAIHRIKRDSLCGLRILFITDIHLRKNCDMRSLIEQTESISPDLILFGGDFADKEEDALRAIAAFRVVKPALGKFSCVGNNDIEAFGKMSAFRNALSKAGIRLLTNESELLTYNGTTIELRGTDEKKYGTPDLLMRHSNTAYGILLTHFPLTQSDPLTDLTLCGHTHGGQYSLFGITPYVVMFEHRYHPLYISGMHEIDGHHILVSKGIGCSKLPFRIGVRSEIDLIEYV